MTYPFTPKSTAKLQFGDYWPICRDDGRFGFVVFLEQWAQMRSGLVAGLLDHVHTSPELDPGGVVLHLQDVGHLHIKTFPETRSEIHGNVASRLIRTEVLRALEAQRKKSIVWGYRIPIQKVNA